jgi:hypothetical protein
MENERPIQVRVSRTDRPVEVIFAHEVHTIKVSEVKAKTGLLKSLSFLVFIGIAVVICYLLWKIAQVLGFLYLAFMFFYTIRSWFHKNDKFQKYIGKTYKEAVIEEVKARNAKDGKEEKEISDTAVLYSLYLVFSWILVRNIIYALFVLCFALDAKYQFFPLNLLGLFIFLVCVRAIVNSSRYLYNAREKVNEVIIERTFIKKTIKFALEFVSLAYIVCIFLVLFGIIGRAG